jgi:hypothetical protein
MLRYSVLKNVQTEMAEHHCAVVEGVRLKNNQNSRALWATEDRRPRDLQHYIVLAV